MIRQLQSALHIDAAAARRLATRIDSQGQTVVCVGEKQDCEDVGKVLGAIDLKTTVQRMQPHCMQPFAASVAMLFVANHFGPCVVQVW